MNFSSGRAKTNLKISFADKDITLIAGFCHDAGDDRPLENVRVTLLPDSLIQLTNAQGIYYYPQVAVGDHELLFSRNGYASQRLQATVRDGISNIDTMQMQSLYSGVLHDFILVIDPRYGGLEPGRKVTDQLNSAQANLKLATLLRTLFEEAGAHVFLIRDKDITLTKDQRIKLCNQMPEGGYYLRLNVDTAGQSAMLFKGGYYAGSESGRKLLEAVAKQAIVAGLIDKTQIEVSNEPEIRLTNRAAISIDLHLHADDAKMFSGDDGLGRIAQAIFNGFLEHFQNNAQ
jgi:N-acetylmuramoyl-L-alanine amidase